MYETGALIAFLLWLYKNVSLVITINSTLERNLSRIEMRTSWLSRESVPLDAAYRTRPTWLHILRFLALAGFGLVGVLFSWLYVVLTVGSRVYEWSKDQGKPTAAKEFHWKMRNLDMAFEQIAREMHTLGLAMGTESRSFEDFLDHLCEQAGRPTPARPSGRNRVHESDWAAAASDPHRP